MRRAEWVVGGAESQYVTAHGTKSSEQALKMQRIAKAQETPLFATYIISPEAASSQTILAASILLRISLINRE
jgi:hypothetical protein